MVLRNSLAHLIARLAGLGAGIAVIPLVTLTLGTEALGLVGIYATIQAAFGLFDFGLPTAINRELSILTERKASPRAQAVLVRSVEAIFWSVSVFLAVAGTAVSGFLAHSWFQTEALPRDVVETSLALILVGAAVRFPLAFYSNALFARERHICPNVVFAMLAAARLLVSFAALTMFKVGIVGFFVIQLVTNIAEVVLLLLDLWRRDPHKFVLPRIEPLRRITRLASVLTGIALTAVVLSQIDKVILSKVLTLGEFGLYAAGYTLGAGLAALAYPIGNALFPQLSRDAERGDVVSLARLMRQGTELTILVVVPLAAIVAAAPAALLDALFLVRPVPPELVGILPAMVIGGASQAFVTLPHLYQVAAGRSLVVLWINTASVAPYGLAVGFAALYGGLDAAALIFAVFNVVRLGIHWFVLQIDPASHTVWSRTPYWVLGMCVLGGVLTLPLELWNVPPAGRIAFAVATGVGIMFVFALVLPTLRQRLRSGWQS